MKKLWTMLIALVISVYLFIACGKPAESFDPPDIPDDETSQPGGEDDWPDDGLPGPGEGGSEPETPEVVPPDNTAPEPPQEEPVEPPPVEPEVPAVQKDILVASKTDSLTVRTGKGSGYPAIGSLDNGDMVSYVALSGGWYQVVYKRQTAYVSASYAHTVAFLKGGQLVEEVIEEGKKLLGIPYVFGAQRYHWGNGMRNPSFDGKSFDCSSFTQYVYKLGAGVDLATTSREQSLQGRAVSSLKRGDLMFFTNDSRRYNTGIERIGHVGIYLGDNMILHTASDHAVIEQISSKRWSYFITARRFL